VVNDQPLASIVHGSGQENVSVVFTGVDETLSGDAIVSWQWDFGGLGSAIEQEASYVFTDPGTYLIELTVGIVVEHIIEWSGL